MLSVKEQILVFTLKLVGEKLDLPEDCDEWGRLKYEKEDEEKRPVKGKSKKLVRKRRDVTEGSTRKRRNARRRSNKRRKKKEKDHVAEPVKETRLKIRRSQEMKVRQEMSEVSSSAR